ncbi:MAG: HAMP domain-containing protein [Deltaproteobacteria bacterium]|nr:HAMP domain-containing protein [Deltaproteobacteria bacterium]
MAAPTRPPPGRLIRSLRLRFLLGVLAVGVLALGGTAIIAAHAARNDMEGLARDRGRVIANSVSANLSSMMTHGTGQAIQFFLSSVRDSALVNDVHIFNPNGVITAAASPNVQGRRANDRYLALTRQGPSMSTTEHTSAGDRLVFIQEIANGPNCRSCHGRADVPIGHLAVTLPFDQYESHMRNTVLRAGVLQTLALVLLVLGSALVISVLVVRPVSRLAQAVRRTADGDLDTRVPVERDDELGRLAQDFNLMAERLRVARREIERSHQESMERAERMASLGELAASLAHEVRNPLSGLSGAVQVLGEHFAGDLKRREVVEEMGSQIQRLGKAVDDLLSFARPARPSLKLVDLNVCMGDVISLMREHAARCKVAVDFKPTEADAQVHADVEQVRQVWVNLMLNAFQAMPAGGTLEVRVEAAATAVEVAFVDSGTGIPEEIRDRIFRPFFTTKHTGTGLGLAICDRIIRDHGGAIDVVSAPGEGSCFTVTLPHSTAPPEVGPVDGDPAAPGCDTSVGSA